MKYDTHHTDNFHIFKPSTVEFDHRAKEIVMDNGAYILDVTKRSQMANQMKLGVNIKELEREVLDGQYFVVDDRIIDHRFGSELKFVHSDESIKALADHLGFATPDANYNRPGPSNRRPNLDAIKARSMTSKFECNATDTLGGQFDINIGMAWSPFETDVESFIEMWRQVCENGAIARSPLMNHSIPMLGQWKENLDISSQVIRHNFDKIVLPRLTTLTTERISMADLGQLFTIVRDLRSSKHLQMDSMVKLGTIEDKLNTAWDPSANRLQKNVLKFIPAPITAYDAMNIATEAATHHTAKDRSSSRAQAFVSGLLFDEKRQRNLGANLDNLIMESQTFNQVDQAFFGTTAH